MNEAAIETVWRATGRARIGLFPFSDNLAALMTLVVANLSESQKPLLPMADWIQQMAEVQEAAEQQAHQDEVAPQPALTPRTLEENQSDPPPVREWPVEGICQPPPPPRARRPDYERRTVANWRHAILYVMNYGHPTEEECQ